MCPLADYCPVISPLAGASLSGYCGSNYRDYYWCTMICAAPNIMAYGNNYVTVRCVARARVCVRTHAVVWEWECPFVSHCLLCGVFYSASRDNGRGSWRAVSLRVPR